jgi:putative transposase
VQENLVNQQFKVAAPNQIWLTGITYIPTEESWLYLAGHKGVFTVEIFGYAMGPNMAKNLVIQSLFPAVVAKGPIPGLIQHSDRGSQSCSYEYRKLPDQFHARALMSRKRDC